MRHTLAIYLKLQLVHLRSHLEYEADIWTGVVGLALTHGAGFVFVWVVFAQIPSVAGWSFGEVGLLFALALIPRSLVTVLCDGPWLLGQLVNRGELDVLLVRPISPAVQVMTQLASVSGFGSLLLGGAILHWSIRMLGLDWSVWQWGFVALTIGSSTVLIGAIIFATNCTVFWNDSPNTSFAFLVQQTLEFVKFPLTLYGQVAQFVLTWVVPFAFVSYFPSLVLLERRDGSWWLGYGTPVAASVVVLGAALIWWRALRRYQSVGH